MAPSRSSAGYSLIELLTVVVLVGVLASLAAPSVRETVRRARVRAALDELSAEVYRARSLAARSGRELHLRFDRPVDGCIPRYWLEDPRLNRRLKAVDLGRGAPGVCVQVSGSRVIRINSRGMPVGAARKVRARVDGTADSLSISWVGRVYRWGFTARRTG